jgi:hypothetical protein
LFLLKALIHVELRARAANSAQQQQEEEERRQLEQSAVVAASRQGNWDERWLPLA